MMGTHPTSASSSSSSHKRVGWEGRQFLFKHQKPCDVFFSSSSSWVFLVQEEKRRRWWNEGELVLIYISFEKKKFLILIKQNVVNNDNNNNNNFHRTDWRYDQRCDPKWNDREQQSPYTKNWGEGCHRLIEGKHNKEK